MTAVEFDNNVLFDRGPAQVVEDNFRAYANWSGVHRFKFDDSYTNASVLVEGGAGWDWEQITTPVPHSMLLEYHVLERGHGAVFAIEPDGSHWMAGVTTDNQGVVYRKIGSGDQALVFSKPINCPQDAYVRWAFREVRMSEAREDVWVTISFWANDQLMFTHAFYQGRVLEGDVALGLASHGDDREITDIRVPLLTDFTEWCSLDPGENPFGGLQRSIEGRYVKFFVRYDGTMRAWTSQPTTSKHNFSDPNKLESVNRSYDRRDLFSHIRMMGAYEQAEFHRIDLSRIMGHRFKEESNPYLMSSHDCRREAEREILRREEKAETFEMVTSYRPLLEPEDRITILTEDWIITSMSWEFQPAQTMQQTASRRYTYGS